MSILPKIEWQPDQVDITNTKGQTLTMRVGRRYRVLVGDGPGGNGRGSYMFYVRGVVDDRLVCRRYNDHFKEWEYYCIAPYGLHIMAENNNIRPI